MSQRMLAVGIVVALISGVTAFIWSKREPVGRNPAEEPGAESPLSDSRPAADLPADVITEQPTGRGLAQPPAGDANVADSDSGAADETAAVPPVTAVERTAVEKTGEPTTSDEKTGDEKTGTAQDVHAAAARSLAFKPILQDWPAPAAAFLLSGEMHGYVEPCGCSLNQLGGLARRADLLRQMKERSWPVTGLDTGGLVSNPARRQAKVKMRMALDSLHELQYSAIAMGVEEAQIGIDLLQFFENGKSPFLSCNLVIAGGDLGTHKPKSITTVGNVKVGITAVFGNSLAPKVASPDGQQGGDGGQGGQGLDTQVLDAAGSLKQALAELQAEKPDLFVLLAHARLAESKELAQQFPQFQLIVSAGGPEDPDPNPQYVGETLVVAPGQKGKHVAVVGYYPDDPGRKLRYEAIALDGDRFQEAPSMREQMRLYQEALAVQELVSAEPRIEDPRNAQLTEANPFVGSKVCGECHQRAYRKWLATGHSKATQSIKTGRAGQEKTYISRIHDPECVACHVTGWDTGRDNHEGPKDYYGYKSGFVSDLATPHLAGQGCENCHGPGERHTELERQFQKDGKETDDLNRFRDFVHLEVDGIGARQCVKCHDGDNDPHFKTDGDVFEDYWKKIAHPWRD